MPFGKFCELLVCQSCSMTFKVMEHIKQLRVKQSHQASTLHCFLRASWNGTMFHEVRRESVVNETQLGFGEQKVKGKGECSTTALRSILLLEHP